MLKLHKHCCQSQISMPVKALKIILFTFFLCTSYSISQAGHIRKCKIRRLIKRSAILNNHFTGFALYDLDRQKTILELNADKYYIPASNTKLFTFYTALKMLGDSIPALKYQERGDSLFFWGTGDPAFLHPDLKNSKVYNLLKQTGKQLAWCIGLYQNPILGLGWAWDDYNDYYQAEITELPLYGNVIGIKSLNGKLKTSPGYFQYFLRADSGFNPGGFKVQRGYGNNTLTYPAAMPVPARFLQDIPIRTGADLTKALLEDTLRKNITLLKRPLPADAKTIYSENADTVYRHMLQPSDNFMAEQLLLACSSVKFGYLNADSVRQYALRTFLADLPDKPSWNDGSGLSRQNLFSPRDIITLLIKIQAEVKDEQLLHSLLPAGGVAGTIRRIYKTDNGQPFVWAKTGTLSNDYNQSGYLVTRKGRRLAFSFMNNNFVDPARTVRDELVRIITYIHDNF